ncbi:MAG: cbb3-type cytochrome c oxidase subunit 3 [Proteobacteria bacterium]|nr:cbb3-type cytochrome c oxidase subunit 3 [Pseudomonadota bacterium]
MSGFSYEAVARFAQQGGTVYFGLLFFAGLIYALWPSRKDLFRRMANAPLDDDGSDHV